MGQAAKVFKAANKGFEGLAFHRHGGADWLYAMCEGNRCTDAKTGGGRVHAYRRDDAGLWRHDHQIDLPLSAEFEDYAGLSVRGMRLAVVSQADACVWIGDIEAHGRGFVGDGTTYALPGDDYCNVEGVAWLSDDELVLVSDKRKKGKQPKRCKEQDQSIHVMRIPS